MNLLSFLFPKRCVGCGKIGRYFCATCISTIQPIFPSETICPACGKSAMNGITHPKCRTKTSLNGLISLFHYRGVIKDAIKSIKYRYVSDIAEELIRLCIQNFKFQSSNVKSISNFQYLNNQNILDGILVPIPLHPSRYKFRGFNQAEKLGDKLSKSLNIPMRIDILTRIRKTTPQVEMKNKADRLHNMKDVFSINPLKANSYELTAILFDDVWTTGATLRSACSELKKAGVKDVWGMTIAR